MEVREQLKGVWKTGGLPLVFSPKLAQLFITEKWDLTYYYSNIL